YRKFGLPEAHPDYLGFEVTCWSCRKPSPCFLWPGIRDWVDPPQPAPRTVKRRFSNTIRETYPANGCVECDALFGDWCLFKLILDYVDYDEGDALVDRFVNMAEPS